MTLRITAIICTRNRAMFLEKCITSLLNQSAPLDEYEILVVDNGSTDSTRDVLSKYEHIENFRHIYEPQVGLSRARNTGWKESRCDIVGYIDDDATVDHLWVESVLDVIDRIGPLPEWIGGPIHLDWAAPAPNWIDDELKVPLGYVDWGKSAKRLVFPERLGGGNSLYRKDVLEKYGGFDERLGRQGASLLSGEETQLQERVEASGGFLYYHPGIKIYHYVGEERLQPSWFYRRYFWGGVSDYFMSKTLASVSKKREAGPEHPRAETRARQIKRALGNCIVSSGLFFSDEKTIHARVYLSYVAGRISSIFIWFFQKNFK